MNSYFSFCNFGPIILKRWYLLYNFKFYSSGIRHPEELSLCYPLEPSHLKQNYQNLKEAKRIKSSQPPDTNTFIAATRGSSNSLDRSNGQCPATPPPPRSLSATPVASQQVRILEELCPCCHINLFKPRHESLFT